MRLDNYAWVFTGWRPPGCRLFGAGFCLAVHLGLPCVQFHAVTDLGCATVRCDPHSSDLCRDAYAVMVQADLEHELAKMGSTSNAKTQQG